MYYNAGNKVNVIPKAIFGVQGLTLAAAGIFYLIKGICTKKMEIAQELGYAGKALALGIFLFLLLLSFSGFTYYVMKKTNNKRVTGAYAIMLGISLGIFITSIVMAPKSRSYFYNELTSQCNDTTGNSYFQRVDALYGIANPVMCSESCMCNADAYDWNTTANTSAVALIDLLNPMRVIPVVKSEDAVNTSTKFEANGLVTIKGGANKYQECPGVNDSLSTYVAANFNHTFDKELSILGAIERDFHCAGMCSISKFYEFSDVGRGPPEHYCQKAIYEKVQSYSRACLWAGIVFAIVTFAGFVFTLMVTFRKQNEITEPLLA